MEHLNEQEKNILELLCTNHVALENFLIESENPRLLPFLNGDNNYNLNIFKKGHTPNVSDWKEHSNFWLPTIYLEKIANRLYKETDIEDSIRKEYASFIQQAFHDILRGYIKEHKPDIAVVQMLLHIIQTQDITSLDNEIINFIITNLKDKNSSVIIRDITPIIKKIILQAININDIKQYIEIMIESLPNEYTYSDYRSDSIKEFLLDSEIINKLAEMCDNDFLLKLADKLTETLKQNKKMTIYDEIGIKIQEDCSLKVNILGTPIEFALPYCEFKDKENIIGPIIRKELKNYNGNDEYLYEKILYWHTYVWIDFTYVTYSSLYNKPKGYYLCRQGVLVYILKEILLLKLQKQGLETFFNIYQFITSTNKSFIFKRILLYCYGKEFDKTRKQLLTLVEQEKYLLFSLYFEAEMYIFLQNNVSQFTNIEKDKIEEIIEDGPYNERIWEQRLLEKSNLIKIKQNWQQDWYSALKETEPFKQKYENLQEQSHRKEFFNFRDGFEAKPSNYKALLKDIEVLALLKNDPEKYVEQIIKFSKDHPNRAEASMYEMPHPEGIADQLQYLSTKYPEIITESIIKLSNLKPIYIRHILYGLRDTKDRKNINWKNICLFIENYIDKLVENEESAQNINKDTDDILDITKGTAIESIIGAWADMILVKKDKDNFNLSEFQRLLSKYLDLLLKNYSFDYHGISYIEGEEKYPADYLTLTINTVTGRVLEKLIEVVIYDNTKNLSFLRDVYDRMLENKVVEAHVFLGLYFIFFYQSIKEWIKEKSNSLLNSQEVKYWEMFFEGFIKSNNQYLDYYTLMFEHYKKAIELYTGRGQDRVIDALVQFFEKDKDDLDKNSLLHFCWDKKNYHILSGCVREISFHLNKEEIPDNIHNKKDGEQEEKIAHKAKKLWDFLWNKISDENIDIKSQEQKELFKNMLGLIPALQSLNNSTAGKISKIIDHLDTKSWEISNLFRDLIYLIEKNNREETEILNLAKLYYKVIQKINYFIFPEQHSKIIEILKKYIHNSKIEEKLSLIKCEYDTKKWHQYLDWFNK